MSSSRMEVGPITGTWVADSLIPPDIRSFLNTASLKLEPFGDWHPGSNHTVLNLVHPSLCFAVAGRSKILRDRFVALQTQPDDYGRLLHFPTEDKNLLSDKEVEEFWGYSSPYQWLPCDLHFKRDGSAALTSYVNGLHPREDGQIYSVLEDILPKMLSMFEKVLADVQGQPRLQEWEEEVKEAKRKKLEGTYIYGREGGGRLKRIRVVEPETEDSVEPTFVLEPVSLRDRKLQVIVKLTNIVLTPSKPKYSGGRWHTEGVKDVENIVASGLYYYSMNNISPSFLALGRIPARSYYDEECEELCQIESIEGRCVAFTNDLLHRAKPFQLLNPKLPGHRKLLAFFLVDPDKDILSTARVPCQSMEWFKKECKLKDKKLKVDKKTKNLYMTVSEAKEYRAALEKERAPRTLMDRFKAD